MCYFIHDRVSFWMLANNQTEIQGRQKGMKMYVFFSVNKVVCFHCCYIEKQAFTHHPCKPFVSMPLQDSFSDPRIRDPIKNKFIYEYFQGATKYNYKN